MAHSPAWPHGALTPFLDELWFVMGTNKVTDEGTELQTSRTMLVVREGTRLTLVNTVRLDEAGLAALDALGRVEDIVRLGAFHGRDDGFYRERYQARVWAVPGSTYDDGTTADRAIADDTPLPIAEARAFVFRSARHPEAAMLLDRAGGLLVTCDAVQNWEKADRFFSPATAAMFDAAGFLRRGHVPSTWVSACGPSRSDFEKLLALPFRHLVSAHGEPLLEHAHAVLTGDVRAVFPSP